MRSFGVIIIFLSLICLPELQAQPAFSIIPGQKENTLRFGLIIGNENYQTYADKYTTDVLHAIYDAEKFAHLLKKNNLVTNNNLSYYPDATNTHIKLILNKISKTTKKSGFRTELVFYFNGKIAHDRFGELCLVPVDATEQDLFFAFPLDDLYERIGAAGIGEAWIFIDAVSEGKQKGPGLVESPGSITDIREEGKPLIHLMQVMEIEEARTAITLADKTPPLITVEEPDQIISNTDGNYRLKGRVTDASGVSVVAVNGEEAYFNVDGSFFANLTLKAGDNKILIEALDNNDNHAEKEIHIVFEPLIKEEIQDVPPVFYAILIGINQYKDPVIPDLDGPVSDIDKLAAVLKELYHFKQENTWMLMNASSFTLWDTLEYLKQIIRPADNLILVYAGHGTWDERTGTGYWLPSDALYSEMKNWISNVQITSRLNELNTRHTLVITDACFGGGLFRVRGLPPDADEDILKKYELRSRNAITSGDLNEVPDVSVFMRQLVNTMNENTARFVTAEQLYNKIKEPVIDATDNIPQFGKIKSSGDEGGDFVFIR